MNRRWLAPVGPGSPGRSVRLVCPALLVREAAKLAPCVRAGLAKDLRNMDFPAALCSPVIESIQLCVCFHFGSFFQENCRGVPGCVGQLFGVLFLF